MSVTIFPPAVVVYKNYVFDVLDINQLCGSECLEPLITSCVNIPYSPSWIAYAVAPLTPHLIGKAQEENTEGPVR